MSGTKGEPAKSSLSKAEFNELFLLTNVTQFV